MSKSDAKLLAFAAELRDAAVGLQTAVDAARGMDHVSLPADGAVSASDVVDYARRISYTTFAPAGYEPGAPLYGIVPPAPQDEYFAVAPRQASRAGGGEGEGEGGGSGCRRGGAEKIHGGGDAPLRRSSSRSTWKPGSVAGGHSPASRLGPGDPLSGADADAEPAAPAKTSPGKKPSAADAAPPRAPGSSPGRWCSCSST